MNNKGFAITGILYTIFILFLMILLSILTGLRVNNSLLEKSVTTLSNYYKLSTSVTGTDFTNSSTNKTAAVTGKYIFLYNGGDCVTYLKKGVSWNNDNVKCFYNTGNVSAKTLTLKSIYKFKEGN